MKRGTLRIYLGAAPGAGKTFAMLQEAHRLLDSGVELVVGAMPPPRYKETMDLLNGLPVSASRVLSPAGLAEMDVDAILDGNPQTVVVDEYEHANAVGGRHARRWQDVEELLEAGIDVFSTLNVQNLASLADAVAAITGMRQGGSVPDDVVRRAELILVDISPEQLRERIRGGHICAAQEIDVALSGFFRLGTLAALRELALLWLADRVDEGLTRYRAGKGIVEPWPVRERVVVGLTGGPEGEVLLRRGARILQRVSGGDLLAVHVRTAGTVVSESVPALESLQQLGLTLGGSYHCVTGEDPALALLNFSRGTNATQIVIGVSRRPPLSRLLFGGGVGARVVRDAGDIDVHLVPHPFGSSAVRKPGLGNLGRKRVIAGFILSVILPVLLQVILGFIPEPGVTTAVLVQVSGCIAIALVGGLWPAIFAALWSSLLLNYFSTPPTGSFVIRDPQNLFALVVFLIVSTAVATVVDRSARRSKEAARANMEARILSELARGTMRSQDALADLLAQARETFHMVNASLFCRAPASAPADEAGPWTVAATDGELPPASPEDGDNVEQIDDSTVLVLSGRILPAADRRLLGAFGTHLAALRERLDLMASKKENLRLTEGNTMRTAILRAVSHDLRTPLTGIKLAVTSLLHTEVRFSNEEVQELLSTIEEDSDRLELLVDNLLDLSRITARTANPLLGPTRWTDVIPGALRGIPSGRIRVDLPPDVPPIEADAGMLERVIANLAENAVKYAPTSEIIITAAAGGLGMLSPDGRLTGEVRVIDHGPGVAEENFISIFTPFQRLDDVPATGGIGLGLAVAQGLSEAMGGTLSAEQSAGGGLTMILRLPLAEGGSRPFDPISASGVSAPQAAGSSMSTHSPDATLDER
jgi:two-component system sensor histidine kinase KdpD